MNNQDSTNRPSSFFSRGVAFVYSLAVLALLLVVGYVHSTDPDWLGIPGSFGSIPVGVFFYGALGAVTISLKGIFDHVADWDPGYGFWHVSRPVVGATMALVLVLIFQSGMLAVGVDDLEQDATEALTYYVLAFLAGYREESLRELLKRLVDTLFVPADRNRPRITAIAPTAGAPGDTLRIDGEHLSSLRAVTVGGKQAAVTSASDTELTVVAPADVTGVATVAVETANGKASGVTFTYG